MLELIKKYMVRERAATLLRKPLIYSLGAALVRNNFLKFPYKAVSLMMEYALEQTKKAYNRRLPFAWTSAFFPVELLHALEIPVFSPEVAASLAASFGFQANCLREAESRWWGRDNCSFHRCAAGGLLNDYFLPPSVFCASSHLCEGAVFMFSSLAGACNRPFILLDLPAEQGDSAISYLTGQLREIISTLEKIAGVSLQEQKLQEAVVNAEATRKAMLKVCALRLDPCSPLTAGEAFSYLYINFTGMGSLAMRRVYETLAEELEGKIEKGDTSGEPRFKLLWLHLPPFYKNNILDYLEGKGAKVVFEEFSHVYWGAMDPKRPLESIAGRMLSHFGYGHVDRRIKVIKELAERYHVDGVVHFSHRGCRQSCGSLRIIRDALQGEGLPFLVLDGDCIDNRNYAPGQMQTRIDAFLEMLA